MLVAELRRRLIHWEPPHLVHLLRGDEGSAERPHDPVANGLRPPSAVHVVNPADDTLQRAAQSGLLLNLADGGLFLRLARVHLPLGQRPVVVLRAVYQRDLQDSALARAPYQAARGSNLDVHGHDGTCFRSRRRHAWVTAAEPKLRRSPPRLSPPPARGAARER